MKRFFLHAGHLGDCWCYLNFLIHNNPSSKIICVSPNPERVEWYKRLYDLIDTNVEIIFEVSPEYDQRYQKSDLLPKCFYSSTKKKYNQGQYIAYSFDANWIPDKKVPPNIEEYLDSKIIKNLNTIKCGLPQTIEEVVSTLSNCLFYIGVDNGVSHVARSVKCPVILIEHNHPLESGFPSKYCSYAKVTSPNQFSEYLNIVTEL